jgi:RNA polymerase sigma-70 factor (ECF subfamily)
MRSRHPVEYLGEQDETHEEIADWSGDAANAAMQHEVQARLEDGISRLPQELRVTLILRDVEGLSTSETATSLEITEAAVKSRLHRARVVLRRHLGDLFADR